VWFFMLFAVFVVAAAGWAWWLSSKPLGEKDQWSSVAGPGLAALALVGPAMVWLWRQDTSAPDAGGLVASAVAGLMQAQYEQWTVEQVARQVTDPYPLPVCWRVSDRAEAVMASWASVRGRPGAEPVPVEGSFEQIAAVFTGPQTPRRLVVLGEPGAGKSMLVLRLTVDLLTSAQKQLAQEPDKAEPVRVPVLVSISGWDPRQPLSEWLAGRLAADYPVLRRTVTGPDGQPRSLAAELVATGRILPILDGLDEITDTQHPAALAGIQAMTGRLPQFVLTCRTQPYENAVNRHGPLAGTPVVEIQPLNTRQASRYLIDGADDGPTRWTPITEHLHTHPDSPLSKVLTTPLYTWLARVAYRHRSSDPSQLLNTDGPQTPDHVQTGIEHHLLDQLIPAAFTTTTGGHPARTPEQAATARRHLTHLAAYLDDHHTYDLAWWRLHQALPRRQLRLAAGLVFGLMHWLISAIMFGTMFGLGHWLAVGLMAVLGGWLGWCVVGLGEIATLSHPRRVAIDTLRLAFGFTGGLAIGLTVGLAGWLVFGLTVGVVAGTTAGLAVGITVGLVSGLGGAVVDGQRAISPTTVLREDRAATLVVGLAGVLAFGGTTGGLIGALGVGLRGGLGVGLGVGLMGGLGVGFVGVWGRFLLVRALLAVRGHAPLRLMAFLQEAHDRGVLRQAGGVYQFRHARLQDRLARHP